MKGYIGRLATGIGGAFLSAWLSLSPLNAQEAYKAPHLYGPDNKKALIVLGDLKDDICTGCEDRFTADFMAAYESLLENDFKQENVKILAEGNMDYGPYRSDGAATRENIEKAFKEDFSGLGEDDMLFAYFTDHGSLDTFDISTGTDTIVTQKIKGTDYPFNLDKYKKRVGIFPKSGSGRVTVAEFSMGGENLYETELESYARNIGAGDKIFVLGFCYSGDFAGGTGKYPNTTAVSINTQGKVGWEGTNDSFNGYLMKGWSPRNMEWKNDANGDGLLSLGEAYRYAMIRNSSSRTGQQAPQIVSGKDASSLFIASGPSNQKLVQAGKLPNTLAADGDPVPDGKPGRYAVILAGGNVLSSTSAYLTLLENGFNYRDIYILTECGYDSYFLPSDGSATKENMDALFGYLSKKLDGEDTFVLYMNGRLADTATYVVGPKGETVRYRMDSDMREGGKKTVLSNVWLGNEWINEMDMERYISSLGHGKGFLLYGPDMGGFVERTGGGANLAICPLATEKSETDGEYDIFGSSLMEALSPKAGDIPDADGDGTRNLIDAVSFAKTRHDVMHDGGTQLVVKTEKYNLDEFSLAK